MTMQQPTDVAFSGRQVIAYLGDEITKATLEKSHISFENEQEQAVLGLDPEERFSTQEWHVISGLLDEAALLARIETLRSVRRKILMSYHQALREQHPE